MPDNHEHFAQYLIVTCSFPLSDSKYMSSKYTPKGKFCLFDSLNLTQYLKMVSGWF